MRFTGGAIGRPIVAGLLCAVSMAAQTPAEKVARGKYLVEEVAQCQLCHTPRIETGEYDRTKWLKGSVLNVQPIEPIKDWHKTAPDITPHGRLWKTWTEPAVLKYLQTGLTPKGRYAGPPMPTYKLPAADAEAIVEYLKSLPAPADQ